MKHKLELLRHRVLVTLSFTAMQQSDHVIYLYLTNSSKRKGCKTRSIFEQSLTGLKTLLLLQD